MRRILSNGIWAVLEPLLNAAKASPVGAKPKLSDREFLEAVLYRARTGLPWRDLPDDFGDWNAVHQRFKRWRLSGVWGRLFAAMPKESPLEGAKLLFIDSTTSRAHQHAAGAEKKRPRTEKSSKTTRPSGVPAGASPARSSSSAPTRTPPSR